MTQAPALPGNWVQSIFTRLVLSYGSARIEAMYRGSTHEDVHAHWAKVLRYCTSAQIAHALDNLPEAHPPNVLEFKALAASYNAPQAREEIEVRQPPSPEQLAHYTACMRELAAGIAQGRYDMRAWARRLKARELAGEHLTRLQRTYWREALHELAAPEEAQP